MRTRLILTVLPVALLGAAVAPSFAAPAKPKPFTKTYEASAPVPAGNAFCDGTVPMSSDLEQVKIPGPGTVKVDLAIPIGDWDLFVSDGSRQVGESIAIQPLTDGESVTVRVKKPTTLTINGCNLNGGPTATVTYSFTPA